MRKKIVSKIGKINRNESVEGKCIEEMIEFQKEGNTVEMGTASLFYTIKEDGVHALGNIRSDRHQLAQDALDTVEKSRVAKRDAYRVEMKKRAEGGQSTEGTQDVK